MLILVDELVLDCAHMLVLDRCRFWEQFSFHQSVSFGGVTWYF